MNIEEMNRIRAVMEKAFPHTDIPENFNDLMYGEIEEWDSLGNYALLMLIEQEFGFEFTMKELTEIKSIKEIIEKVKTLK